MTTPYLQKRRRRYLAVVEIPHALRPVLGKARFMKSLQTEDLAEAKKRVGPVTSAWFGEIERAKKLAGEGEAERFRWELRNAKTKEERDSLLEWLSDRADEIAYLHGDIGEKPSEVPEALEFYAERAGWRVPTDDHLDEWAKSLDTVEKVRSMWTSYAKRFAAKFPRLADVTKPAVKRWTIELLNGSNGTTALSAKTVASIISAVRSYWRFLESLGVITEDNQPFEKLGLARGVKRDRRRGRQPFEPAEAVRLLNTALANGDSMLADLIRLGMLSGARIEELCALKTEDVHGDWFEIRDAKTRAGDRPVPVHLLLQPTLARLVAASSDGYVLSGLKPDRWGDRSPSISKRFSKLKTGQGFGRLHTFHSLRHTVATELKGLVPESTVSDLLGHEYTGGSKVTVKSYMGATKLKLVREALEKLTYPDYPLDDAPVAPA